ncbi:hypothetical protein KGQ72_02985 [Patescibacteria group bacterium]|nr:hypothetical protein [Patescibacteria group bacterium]
MRKIVSFCAAALVAFAVVGCGSSGGGDGATPVTSNVAATPVADVTFVNVLTDPSKTSVIPGERDVVLARFYMSWSISTRSSIVQLVFKNPSSSIDLWSDFRGFKLVSETGDVWSEAPYQVLRDDATQEVTIDFFSYSWFPNDFGTAPKVYSLVGSVNPLIPIGDVFSFDLIDEQMHNASVTTSSNVKGGQFAVAVNAFGGMPVIKTSSSSTVNVSSSSLGVQTVVGKFTATCPTGSVRGCILDQINFFVQGVSDPQLVVQGAGSSYSPGIPHFVPQGTTQEFLILAVPSAAQILVSVSDMEWTAGDGTTRISPTVPVAPEACGGLLVADTTGCKG